MLSYPLTSYQVQVLSQVVNDIYDYSLTLNVFKHPSYKNEPVEQMIIADKER